MNKCFVCCGLAAVLITLPASAQQSWTLRQCADYAVEHNISIKQKGNQRKQRDIQLSTAKNSRLPDLSASASESSTIPIPTALPALPASALVRQFLSLLVSRFLIR